MRIFIIIPMLIMVLGCTTPTYDMSFASGPVNGYILAWVDEACVGLSELSKSNVLNFVMNMENVINRTKSIDRTFAWINENTFRLSEEEQLAFVTYMKNVYGSV